MLIDFDQLVSQGIAWLFLTEPIYFTSARSSHKQAYCQENNITACLCSAPLRQIYSTSALMLFQLEHFDQRLWFMINQTYGIVYQEMSQP